MVGPNGGPSLFVLQNMQRNLRYRHVEPVTEDLGYENFGKDLEKTSKAELGYYEEIAKLVNGPGGELEAAREIRDLRLAAAKEGVDQELIRIDYLKQEAEITTKEARESEASAQKAHEQIAGSASGLFRTLFTKPQDFGRRLMSTVRESVLAPITSGLGNMVANIFAPAADPVRQNTAALLRVAALLTALATMGAGAGPAVGGVPQLFPMPAAQTATITGVPSGGIGVGVNLPSDTGPRLNGWNGIGLGAGPIWGMGDTSSAYMIPNPRSRSGGGVLGGIFAGSGRTGGGKSGGFNLGGLFGGSTNEIVGYGEDGTPHDQWGNPVSTSAGGWKNRLAGLLGGKSLGGLTRNDAGSITGVNGLAGAGLMMGGTALADAGILGNARGTWGGAAESTVGGAAIGFQMAGPLGAGIGAVAGLGISVGEMIAGIESPARKAQKDIKAAYGINIPENSGTIKQVVSIAQSQYGGDIAIAVRSPSVRQLVMLYSEATGQKMPLSATTPYAGSLVEQGGKPCGKANYFGVKRAARHALWCLVTTREWFTQMQIADWNRKHPAEPARPTGKVNGDRIEVALDDEFADYASLADSCKDYAWMIQNVEPYRTAWGKYQANRDMNALIVAVARVYATSPSYTQLAIVISRQANVGIAIAQARRGVTNNATEA
jgi:hypothetical protein